MESPDIAITDFLSWRSRIRVGVQSITANPFPSIGGVHCNLHDMVAGAHPPHKQSVAKEKEGSYSILEVEYKFYVDKPAWNDAGFCRYRLCILWSTFGSM
jgi:hypothetical protein